MSRHKVNFAGTDLSTYGVYISGSGIYNAPEREYDDIIVPGRNGTLLGNEKRLANVEVTYPAFCYTNFNYFVRALKSFLLSKVGYYPLWDTYYPDEIRMACYRGGTEFDMTRRLDAGSFDLTFDCKPERYLTSGQSETTYAEGASTTINNPTPFDAKPLLRVYGTGEFTIGTVTVTVLSNLAYTDIDCDLCDAYYGTVSRNFAIELSGNDFPTLAPGSNAVTVGTGITSVKMVPRWYMV